MSDQFTNDNPGSKPPGTTVGAPVTEEELDQDRSSPWQASTSPEMGFWVWQEDGTAVNYTYSSYAGAIFLGGVLRIYLHEATVIVRGRHLETLAMKIGRNQIMHIREKHASEYAVSQGDAYIDAITIKGPNLEALARNPA